jgi:hypothetical protein
VKQFFLDFSAPMTEAVSRAFPEMQTRFNQVIVRTSICVRPGLKKWWLLPGRPSMTSTKTISPKSADAEKKWEITVYGTAHGV